MVHWQQEFISQTAGGWKSKIKVLTDMDQLRTSLMLHKNGPFPSVPRGLIYK